MPRTLDPAAHTAPLEPPPNRKRWTRAECRFLENRGLLEHRYELIDGEIILRMPPKPAHRIVVILIAAFNETHLRRTLCSDAGRH